MRIRGNVKGGPIDIEIGQKTLIVGPNGSGKSAITETVRLALAGYAWISGIGACRKPAELRELVPEGADQLRAEVDIDGDQYRWVMQVDGDKTKRPSVFAGPVIRLPLDEIREAMTSTEKARRFFLRYAVTASNHDIAQRIPALHRDPFLSVFDAVVAPDPVSRLLEAREVVHRKHLDARKAASEAAPTGVMDQPPTEAQLEAAQNAHADLVAAGLQEQAHRTQAAGLALQITGQARVVAQLEEVLARQARVLDAPINMERAQAAMVLLGRALDSNAATCGLCGSPLDLERARANYDMIARLISVARQAGGPAVTPEQLPAARVRLQQLREMTVPARVDGLPARIEASQRELDAMKRAQWQWSAAAESRDRKARAEADRDRWAQVRDSIDDTIEALLLTGAESFAVQVSAYLPKGDVFALQLTSSACRYGLRRGSVLHTALSDAEWVRVNLALAAVIGDAGSMLIPEDRAFDPDTLGATLKALKDAPGMVIMCSPIKPRGGARALAGWTVIETPIGGAPAAEADDGATVGVADDAAAPDEPVQTASGAPVSRAGMMSGPKIVNCLADGDMAMSMDATIAVWLDKYEPDMLIFDPLLDLAPLKNTIDAPGSEIVAAVERCLANRRCVISYLRGLRGQRDATELLGEATAEFPTLAPRTLRIAVRAAMAA